jgi:uncharacterized protein (DUF1778 family)
MKGPAKPEVVGDTRVRFSPDQYDKLRKAAEIMQLQIAVFIRSAAMREAIRVLEKGSL